MHQENKEEKSEFNILGIGDVHGRDFPNLAKVIEENRVDFVVCTGDLCEGDELRELTFKFWDIMPFGVSLVDIIGKEKYQKLVTSSILSQDKIIRRFASINKKVYMISGNWDYLKSDVNRFNKLFGTNHISLEERLRGIHNIIVVDDRVITHDNLEIVGFGGYVSPRKLAITGGLESSLTKLFAKVKDTSKSIFLTHEPPHGILDKVKWSTSPAYGQRIGNPYYLRAIKKFGPLLHFCGHIHEGRGHQKVGRTTVVNLGALEKEWHTLVSIRDDKVSVREVN